MNFTIENGSILKKTDIELLATYLETTKHKEFDVIISRNTYTDELELELVPVSYVEDDAV